MLPGMAVLFFFCPQKTMGYDEICFMLLCKVHKNVGLISPI